MARCKGLSQDTEKAAAAVVATAAAASPPAAAAAAATASSTEKMPIVYPVAAVLPLEARGTVLIMRPLLLQRGLLLLQLL